MTVSSDTAAPSATLYYTPKQVATLFNISRWTLRAWTRKGLTSVGSGKRRRYLLDDVLAFLERTKA